MGSHAMTIRRVVRKYASPLADLSRRIQVEASVAAVVLVTCCLPYGPYAHYHFSPDNDGTEVGSLESSLECGDEFPIVVDTDSEETITSLRSLTTISTVIPIVTVGRQMPETCLPVCLIVAMAFGSGSVTPMTSRVCPTPVSLRGNSPAS